MLSSLALSVLGGWALGLIFTACRIPLPVPPLMGLIAAAAVLAGQASWNLIATWLASRG
jgi:XapX domain-containing protein